MRNTTTLVLALAAGLAAGCGSDDEQDGAPIPAATAQELESRLAEIERRLDFGGGACADISDDSEPAVRDTLASLPQDVDPDVRDSLEQSFDRLFQLTAEQCDEQQGQETETEEEPPPVIETPTETAPPDDDEEEEDEGEAPPTDTAPTDTAPPETDVPPEQGGGALPEQGDSALPGQGDGGGAIVPEGNG